MTGVERQAWILPVMPGLEAVVGGHELRHLGSLDALAPIPATARHCSEMLIWQAHVIPAFDIAVWLGRSRVDVPARFAALVAYRHPHTGQVHLGALKLAAAPRSITVASGQCFDRRAGGATWEAWRPLALGYIGGPDGLHPLLHLAAIFSQPAAKLAAAE